MKSYDSISKLVKAAANGADEVSASQALQITESTGKLQLLLDQSSGALSDAYRQGVTTSGQAFPLLLTEDGKELFQHSKNE